MMSIEQRQEQILKTLNAFPNASDRYEYIIERGITQPQMDESERAKALRVPECKTGIWMNMSHDGKTLSLRLDSDSIIMRGILSLIQSVFHGADCTELENAAFTLHEAMDIGDFMNSDRAQGLSQLMQRIRHAASS
ncbi:SufE family protein [Desulfobaculum bizertense]|nr:SufE family protein [Desulfobaculum bizertense]